MQNEKKNLTLLSRSSSRTEAVGIGGELAVLQMWGVDILHSRPRPGPSYRRAPRRRHRRCSAWQRVGHRGGDLRGGRGWAGTGHRLTSCSARAVDTTAGESTARSKRRRGVTREAWSHRPRSRQGRPTRVSKIISEWRRWDAVEALDVAAAAPVGRGDGATAAGEAGERCVSERIGETGPFVIS
jgi:hypothetical protein